MSVWQQRTSSVLVGLNQEILQETRIHSYCQNSSPNRYQKENAELETYRPMSLWKTVLLQDMLQVAMSFQVQKSRAYQWWAERYEWHEHTGGVNENNR